MEHLVRDRYRTYHGDEAGVEQEKRHNRADDADGAPTAFSAFQRYGIDYYPADTYRYRGDRDLAMADVLIHAVLCAEGTKQMAMCRVFYLTHRATMEPNELWRLAGKWSCVERWADLQAHLDQREVKQEELFLPWEEFTALARDYGVYPREKQSVYGNLLITQTALRTSPPL